MSNKENNLDTTESTKKPQASVSESKKLYMDKATFEAIDNLMGDYWDLILDTVDIRDFFNDELDRKFAAEVDCEAVRALQDRLFDDAGNMPKSAGVAQKAMSIHKAQSQAYLKELQSQYDQYKSSFDQIVKDAERRSGVPKQDHWFRSQ